MDVKRDKGKINLDSFIKEFQSLQVKVGWLSGKKYENGTSVAENAATQEFGSPKKNIPPRPFIRPAIKTFKKNIKKTIKPLIAQALNKKITPKGVMETLGGVLRDEIKENIIRLMTPELSEYTKQKKGFSKPLIETSTLLNTVDISVEKK